MRKPLIVAAVVVAFVLIAAFPYAFGAILGIVAMGAIYLGIPAALLARILFAVRWTVDRRSR